MQALIRTALLCGSTLGTFSCNDGGPAADSSNAALAAAGAALPAPRYLISSPSALGQIRLAWRDLSSSEGGFEIRRSTTGVAGSYSVVATLPPNTTTFTNTRLSAGREYCYEVRAVSAADTPAASNRVCTRAMSGAAPAVRVVTFGDSNTDWGVNGTSPQVLARSYVSESPNSAASLPHGPDQLAYKIETRWRDLRANAIRAVNHGISGTTTGGGGFGGPNRRSTGAPQARTVVGGITRFQGEVLGLKWPWSGSEPTNAKYVEGSLRRVHSFAPGANDFVYVSMGTNDAANNISTQQSVLNLAWMIDRWVAAGKKADHFLLTTLAPRAGPTGQTFPALNDRIRTLAESRGVVLIDLATHTSADNGLTWRSASLHVGDAVHYSEVVRDWLAERIVTEMNLRVP